MDARGDNGDAENPGGTGGDIGNPVHHATLLDLWRLDIASVRATQELLLERRSAGAGVLMVSEDLDELMSVADRIVVLHDGEVAGVVDPAETDRQAIGRLMLQGEEAAA